MLNVLSLFSGIGAFEKALDNLGIPYKLIAYCERDKYASKAYSIIHDVPEEKNLNDVNTIDFLSVVDRVDLITYGFPCQDISVAGKQKGFTDEEGNRTRSGLFFEALRIIDDYRPKFAIAENVKALTSKRFAEEFKTVLESLEEVGYVNYWAVLNATDYCIPQKRERVFIISIRKDIDKGFTFPEPIPLSVSLNDVLENKVDEKYYLSDATVKSLFSESDKKMITPEGDIYRYIGSDKIDSFDVGDCADISFPNGYNKGNRVYKGVSPSITVTTVDRFVIKVEESTRKRIRKLTPTECYKLMGFTEEDCLKAKTALNETFYKGKDKSSAQLYKQDGNSIGVKVIEAIYKSLAQTYDEFKPRKIFFIAASRGRNTNNSNGASKWVQQLEINKEGVCNTLTSALKDNYVIEIDVEEDIG